MQLLNVSSIKTLGAKFAATASRVVRAMDHAMSGLRGAPMPSPMATDPFQGILPFELTNKRALSVPVSVREGKTIADVDYSAKLLNYAGLATIPNVVPKDLAKECGTAAKRLTDEVRQLVREQGFDPDDPGGFQFRGAHQRDPGRIDVRNHHSMDAAPFDHALLNQDATFLPVVKRVLGDDCQLIFKGLVVTEPGTDEQAYHPDGPQVSREVWTSSFWGRGWV